mmetsp:Transcript_33658/g.51948  ORF Transcript_33658/g.51948 Transcript_33658/m.51948 type:complete len:273 (+) Transcript_33658:2878-3696(+)
MPFQKDMHTMKHSPTTKKVSESPLEFAEKNKLSAEEEHDAKMYEQIYQQQYRSHSVNLDQSNLKENLLDYTEEPINPYIPERDGLLDTVLQRKLTKLNNERLNKMRDSKKNELLAYQSFLGQSLHQGNPAGDDMMEGEISMMATKEDGENQVFNETAKEQEERIKKNSPFGNLLTWKLLRVIVKSNDDVRQEQFAMQLISTFDQIFKLKKLDLWLKPYEILATGQKCGLIEVATDALSIDSIKKKMGKDSNIKQYFKQQFGSSKGRKYKKAR